MKLPQRSQLEQKTDYDYEQDYAYELKSFRPLTLPPISSDQRGPPGLQQAAV